MTYYHDMRRLIDIPSAIYATRIPARPEGMPKLKVSLRERREVDRHSGPERGYRRFTAERMTSV